MRHRIRNICLAGLLLGGSLGAADSKDSLVDGLNQDALQNAFRILRERSIQGEAIGSEELNRAALHGLIERLEFGAYLGTGSAEKEVEKSPPLYELLTGQIGYLRISMADIEDIAAVREALVQLVEEGMQTLILDLRGGEKAGAFEIAAGVLDEFLPAGKELFEVRKHGAPDGRVFESKREPTWSGELFLLVGSRSNANAEAVAGVLEEAGRGTLVGEQTRGAAVRYERLGIGGDHWLEIPTAEVVLRESGSFYHVGIPVDLELAEASEAEAGKLIEAMRADGVSSVVEESQRPRFNEAALVAGTNPELAYRLAQGRGEKSHFDSVPLIDRGLQQLVDLIVARRFLDAVGEQQISE